MTRGWADPRLGGAMTPTLEMISYWLVPDARHRPFFDGLIAGLAAGRDAPVFEPHVTVYAGLGAGVDSPEAVVEAALGGLGPLTLRADRVRWSALFTKTLYLDFHPSEPLARLSAALRDGSARPGDYTLAPHLSLMYRTLPEAEQTALATSISVPYREVTFDRITAVLCPARTETREDVERWQVAHTRHLR